MQKKYDILLGMGISKDALPVYLRNGFNYMKSIPRYVKVLNWDIMDAFGESTALAKKINRFHQKTKKNHSFIIKKVTKTAIDKINCSFYKTNNLFSRDYEYIKWRYIEHPMFNYKLSIVHSTTNTKGAFVSTRLEKISDNFSILHIIDIYGDSNDMLSAISYVINEAQILNASIVDYFGTNSYINSFFISNGWFSILDHEFFNFPHLFQPIELRNPSTTSLIYWSKNNNLELSNVAKLYITKQDLDFDRPVMPKIN